MHETEIIRGFSELKTLLIQTYKIARPRNEIKLHFTATHDELWMHDFQDHNKCVSLSYYMSKRFVRRHVTGFGRKLVLRSLEETSPVDFLKMNFQLYGHFRL